MILANRKNTHFYSFSRLRLAIQKNNSLETSTESIGNDEGGAPCKIRSIEYAVAENFVDLVYDG